MRVTLIVTVTVLCSVTSTAPSFALTGNQWRAFPKPARQAYVAGVMDGWRILQAADADLGTAAHGPAADVVLDVVRCAVNRQMTYEQVVAIVEKRMHDRPDDWNYDMASLVWGAMDQACKDAK
jgi:hypothetical protein